VVAVGCGCGCLAGERPLVFVMVVCEFFCLFRFIACFGLRCVIALHCFELLFMSCLVRSLWDLYMGLLLCFPTL
jgi:hypothetical protein